LLKSVAMITASREAAGYFPGARQSGTALIPLP
jgi:hypothetical protein